MRAFGFEGFWGSGFRVRELGISGWGVGQVLGFGCGTLGADLVER